MALTKVLIAVKTYPILSAKYDELVCTAGFREDCSWIRIYPIQFRKKTYHEQYKKYDWIELDLVKNESDFRPESFRPYSLDSSVKISEHIGTENNWEARKKICLGKIYNSLSQVISEAKDKNISTSLAVFKPTEILDFSVETVERQWDKDKLAQLNQLHLFEADQDGKLGVVNKLPYKFKYTFKDNQGKESKMMIEDWEIGQLYWNCLAKHEGDEKKALADVRKKYFDEFTQTKDLYFFLGTTQKHDFVSINPFIMVGLFYPKIEFQPRLF